MCSNNIAPGHEKSEAEHRQNICTAGNWLYERGFIPACDGNLSVRLMPRESLQLPRILQRDDGADDLVITDVEGRKLRGNHEPSSELAMHLLIYKRRADANAICHAHPPIATGFAAAGIALDKPLLAEMVVTFGRIPLAPFALPGTSQVPWSLEPLVANTTRS